MGNSPLRISVVTVVYNDKLNIEKTIESVLSQTYKNMEYAIIDGNSNDGTFNIIEKYADKIDILVSEADEGIYDAMNKGIDLVNGDFTIFMNAGDTFFDANVLANVVDAIDDRSIAYFGRANIHFDTLTWYHPTMKFNQTNIDIWLKKEQANHQAIFYPKSYIKKEKYNLKYLILGDLEHKYRTEQSIGFKFIDVVVCNFALDGISSRFKSYQEVKHMLREGWEIDRQYKGTLRALETTSKFFIKYIMRFVFQDQAFFSFIKKIKRRS